MGTERRRKTVMGDRKEHVPEKPEVTFTIKRAVEADVPEINAIMQEAASDQTHPDWFVSSDINYIRRNLSECGITAIARTAEGEAAGFFIIELPEGGVDELADFLGFTEEQKKHTGIMDTAVVTRRFRGYGLQGRMLAFCEDELKDRELWYYLTTIHPDNKYSLANMQGGAGTVHRKNTELCDFFHKSGLFYSLE